MKNFLARIAYWNSLGWDQTEGQRAIERERERLLLLKSRIGTKAFKKFRGGDKGAKSDPAFYASIAVFLIFFATPFAFVLALVIK